MLAVAHVRGGGEFGKPWHQAGRMATKPNTWKDFIACGEYLVRERYTSPAKLAGEGTSAGGILIGRAITERPDLFAAAIVNVGCTDMVRAETTTNGVPNIKEFGTVTTQEGFDALLAMSPYHHVTPGDKYPAVLLIHGVNDPRVDPWMTRQDDRPTPSRHDERQARDLPRRLPGRPRHRLDEDAAAGTAADEWRSCCGRRAQWGHE